MHTGFWWGNLRKGDHLQDLGVDGRIILKWIFKKWVWGMDWIDQARKMHTCFEEVVPRVSNSLHNTCLCIAWLGFPISSRTDLYSAWIKHHVKRVQYVELQEFYNFLMSLPPQLFIFGYRNVWLYQSNLIEGRFYQSMADSS